MPFLSSVLGTLAPLKLCHGYACPSQALSLVRLPFSSSATGTLALLKLRLRYACRFQALSWVRLPFSSSVMGALALFKLCHGCACPSYALPRVRLLSSSFATGFLFSHCSPLLFIFRSCLFSVPLFGYISFPCAAAAAAAPSICLTPPV